MYGKIPVKLKLENSQTNESRLRIKTDVEIRPPAVKSTQQRSLISHKQQDVVTPGRQGSPQELPACH